MKINFILAFFAATVLSSSGYRLAAQPAKLINIPFAEPATMDGGTKTLNINIWKGVGDDPQPVVLFVHGGQWELGNNDLIKTYVTAHLTEPSGQNPKPSSNPTSFAQFSSKRLKL